MNLNLFIAQRLLRHKDTGKQFSRPVVKIALIGIALGLSVMIISMAVVSGFKREIRSKIFGFGSHIQIINYDNNYSYETEPIPIIAVDTAAISKIKGVTHIQPFATKAGIIKANNEAQGIVLKGIDNRFDWSFFDESLTEGKSFRMQDSVKSDEIVISKYIANLLNVKTGDKLVLYFIEQPPRMRKFTISGIYETHMEEFDKMFAICDIRHIQKLNNWEDNLISGYEISVDDFSKIEEIVNEVSAVTGTYIGDDGSRLKTQTIMEKYPYIFDWIGLFNTNLWVIFILMTLVSGFNMISGLLVIILERTNMIGIFKALGYNNISIRKIFLYQAAFLIRNGMLWGNIIGIGLVLIQQYTHLIALDKESYYIEYVPVHLDLIHLLLLNVGFMVVILVMLMLPSFIISRISPIKAIRFN